MTRNINKVHARYDWNRQAIELVLLANEQQGKIAQLHMVNVPADGTVCDGIFLSEDTAQQLMNELWRAGLRPMEGTGSPGAVAAVERHRDDLRTIAFKLLEQVCPTDPNKLPPAVGVYPRQ